MNPTLAIIGGSGLYAMKDITVQERRRIDTPFGPTSDPVELGTLNGMPVAFLSRHGAGHRLLPAEVPYRANLWALKSLGVRAVISFSAVGSLQARHAPGTLRLPDQFIDRTVARTNSFFGDGLVAHVSLADPTCPMLRARLLAAGLGAGLPIEDGGTYVCMQGPAFSTRAESRLHQAWGADYIGMTQATEAKLAREAELCYATVALVTDYDAWREAEPGADGADIFATVSANIEKSRQLLRAVSASLAEIPPCGCQEALKTALVTPPDQVPAATRARLALLVGRYGYGA
jgi:5'-methylthioadenosine phosphorylase